MTEDTLTSGFRSLVQKIQENDAESAERQRPQRRRLTLRREPRPEAEAPTTTARPTQIAPVRLLQRRWL